MIRFQFDMTVLTNIGDPAFPYSSEFMVLIAGEKMGNLRPVLSLCVGYRQ